MFEKYKNSNYTSLLTEIIKESGLSIREISRRCTTIGVPISASYISQLQKGKQSPPSEEVSKALANVCNYDDPTKLIVYGYLEKAPDLIRYLVITGSEVIGKILEQMPPEDVFFFEPFIKDIEMFRRYEMAKDYLWKINTRRNIKNRNYRDQDIYMKYIIHGSDIFMDDNSMEPVIPKGAKLITEKYDDINPKSNVVVVLDIVGNEILERYGLKEDEKLIRRYVKQGDKHMFVPENTKDFEIIILDEEERKLTIFAQKVVSYTASVV